MYWKVAKARTTLQLRQQLREQLIESVFEFMVSCTTVFSNLFLHPVL